MCAAAAREKNLSRVGNSFPSNLFIDFDNLINTHSSHAHIARYVKMVEPHIGARNPNIFGYSKDRQFDFRF